MTRLTMADVKRHNEEKSYFFFSKDTMKFFRSKIESTLYKNHTFITSEVSGFGNDKRCYTVRYYIKESGRIERASESLVNISEAREIAANYKRENE